MLSSVLLAIVPRVSPHPLDFLTNICAIVSPSLIRVACSALLILLDAFTLIVSGEQYKSLSTLLSGVLQSYVILSILGLNILRNSF